MMAPISANTIELTMGGAEVDMEARQDQAGDEGTDHADDEIADQAEPSAVHDHAGQPSCDDADNEKDDQRFAMHGTSTPVITGSPAGGRSYRITSRRPSPDMPTADIDPRYGVQTAQNGERRLPNAGRRKKFNPRPIETPSPEAPARLPGRSSCGYAGGTRRMRRLPDILPATTQPKDETISMSRQTPIMLPSAGAVRGASPAGRSAHVDA
ncbi:hypothetical protein J3R73_005154 [Labrys monachus]|uniref:Uncharacterized protein n=1 Tax=Labrys monachus TaxID=217067 RepID=A0ABU0FL76_9HYPH|nr:hypothetical protein [Labrys monachus]